MTVEAVKDKLWKKCGTSVNSMHLELYDDARNKLADLTDNSKPLGFYSPLDGFVFFPFSFIYHSLHLYRLYFTWHANAVRGGSGRAYLDLSYE